ncbi:MAG: hypothetical protein IJR91_05565 [Ruminococcus sp.]|nr:hypothetical protein [Ruminococcus sp.]
MKHGSKHRILSALLAVIFMFNMLDMDALKGALASLRAYADESDYSVRFSWNVSSLSEAPEGGGSATVGDKTTVTDKNGKELREFTLDQNALNLALKECADENPVLKTNFSFHLKRSIAKGDLKFTITGMSGLKRSGGFTFEKDDPNVTKMWDVSYDASTDTYTFVNNTEITSNSLTVFAWQFNSRDAVSAPDSPFTLKTGCIVTEHETDGEGNDIKIPVELKTDELTFAYESVHDQNQVKIVCEDIEELDTNNLNTAYEWRSYRSVLGLEGLTEYDKSKDKQDRIAYDETTAEAAVTDAHVIEQDSAEQRSNRNARGIKSSDYYIDVDPGVFDVNDILILDSNGNRVDAKTVTVGGKNMLRIYNFSSNKSDFKPGESYSSVYRIGVLNSSINNTELQDPKQITLTGHYLVTYNDETTPVDYTDEAAHIFDPEHKPTGAGGEYFPIEKRNSYEVNQAARNNNGIYYHVHAKPASPVDQLLYESIFSGKTVTYSLYANTKQPVVGEEKVKYDLVYEDGAPSIENLNLSYTDSEEVVHSITDEGVDVVENDGSASHVLRADEYDFTRVKVGKLIDGNTVGPEMDENGSPVMDSGNIVYKTPDGFAYEVYAHVGGIWSSAGSGNTVAESEVFLPEGTDDVRVVVKGLEINAPVRVWVDIRYNVNMTLYNYIKIDTVNDGSDDKELKVDENTGSRLRNIFTRTVCPGAYSSETYTESESDDDKAYSLSWLREATTTIDSGAAMEPFDYKAGEKDTETGVVGTSYYTTNITASGKVQSDNQRSLNSFVVVSKLPAGVEPTEEYLAKLTESFRFSGVLQGTGQTVDEQFVKDNGYVSFSYDKEKGLIVARFDFDGVYLDGSQETTASFTYPASISANRVSETGLTMNNFTAETYVTVLDSNVKLSPARYKTLVTGKNNPYNDLPASKSSATRTITAHGSTGQEKADKFVSSSYTDWVSENTAVVDGSNTDHLDTSRNRMTSEYTYKLMSTRIATDTETMTDPILLDIVEGLNQSKWKGGVKSISFKDGYYPAYDAETSEGYTPEVYYVTDSSDSVSSTTEGDYAKTNPKFTDLLNTFKITSSEEESVDQKTQKLNMYKALNESLTSENIEWGWKKAALSDSGEWVISGDDIYEVYAVAVLFRGSYTISDNVPVSVKADLNMKAPNLTAQNEQTNNNRVTYNEVQFYAKATNDHSEDSALDSASEKTLVVLRHMVELVKVSSKNPDKRLTGAEFSVYTDAGCQTPVVYYEKNEPESKRMENMEVDASGSLSLNLSPGVFYYKEVKAPQGYHPDDRPYRFRVVSDSNAVYYYTVDLKTADAASNEYLVVNDKEYDVYKDSVYSGKSFMDSSHEFHVYDANGNAVSRFEWDETKKAFCYNISAASDQLDTKAGDGKITISDLPAGTYFFGKTPNDKDGYSFSVADNSSITLRVMTKSRMSDGVAFSLYESTADEGVAADDKLCMVSGSNGEYSLSATGTAKTFTPDSSGRISIIGLDSSKRYYLSVENAPAGFKKSTVHYLDKNSSSVELVACEQLLYTDKIIVEDDPIEIASANFIKKDGTLVGGLPAGENGTHLGNAEYTMYVVSSDGSEVPVYFKPREGSDANERMYLYVGTEGKEGTTTALSSSYGGTTGSIRVEGLPYGTYIIQESKAPAGFELSSKRYTFYVSAKTIDENGELIFGEKDPDTDEYPPMELLDDEMLSSIVLKKKDKNDESINLKNAQYTLFRLKKNDNAEVTEEDYLTAAQKAVENAKGDTSKLAEYWETVRSAYTDTTGEAVFDGLPFGTYLLYETLPPIGYTWNNDLENWSVWTQTDKTANNAQIIVINCDTVVKNSELVAKTVTNESGEEVTTYERVYYDFFAKHLDDRRKGSARLIKTSSGADSKPLKDGSFTLYKVKFTNTEIEAYLNRLFDNDTAKVDEIMADEEKKNSYAEQMSPEDFKEAQHFDSSGVITNAGKPIDDVVKQGLRTNSQPEGATETVSGLDWGVYYFLEVKAPEGYQADKTPQLFKVDAASSDATIEVSMTDEKIYGEVWLYKQDKDPIATGSTEHEKLFGAQFELYDSTNSKVLSVPRLRIGGLTDSTEHRVSNGRKEFIVKSFEVIDKDTIVFTIVDDNGTDTYTVTVDYLVTGDYQSKGKVETVTVAEDAFKTKYGNGTYLTDDLRLAYYAMTANKSQIYDDSQKKYRLPTDLERQYASYTYVTANEGGRLNVRGLDWDSYYFHETVPPVGYSLSEDVIFSVNSFNCGNQFIKCEDPKKQAEIIIDKEIPNKDYFKAYGEPTFLFKVHKLRAAAEGETAVITKDGTSYVKTGKNYTLAIHMSETTGSAMLSVPEGQYLIEELPVSRYTCTGLELVKGGNNVIYTDIKADMVTSSLIAAENKHTIDTKRFVAFCDLTDDQNTNQGEILTFRVKYKNEIKRYDNFSEVTFADNRIPGETYVTSFKPIYEPLVTADKYHSDDTGKYYEIDLSQALTDREFMAKIVYNNGVSQDLDLEHIDNMKFRGSFDSSFPFDHATFEKRGDDYYLKLTFKDDFDSSNVAGQTISFDVGYGKNGLEAYDTNNTGMIRGTLNLTFDETPSDIRKRVVFKTDANNRSIFNLPAGDGIEQRTAEELIYTQAADTGSVTSEPTAFTDLTVLAEGYEFKYWYLLDADGKPVTDAGGNIVQYADEAAIKAYIFADSNANVNTFTFQAEVAKNEIREVTARLTGTNQLKTIITTSSPNGLGISNAKTTVTAILRGDKAGYDNAEIRYEYTGGVSDTYPDYIRFYSSSDKKTIYWYTVDVNGNPTNGDVYLEGNQNEEFYNWALQDISGLSDWDLSGISVSANRMFAGTQLTEVVFNRTINITAKETQFNRLFNSCKSLTSVKMNLDTSGTTLVQFKETFAYCWNLSDIDVTADLTGSNPGQIFNNFSECKVFNSDQLVELIAKWKLPKTDISNFVHYYTYVNDLESIDIVDNSTPNNHYIRSGDNLNYVGAY